MKKQIGGAIYTLRDIYIKGHTRRGHTYMVERRNIHTEKMGSDSGGKGCLIFYLELTIKNDKEK